jgi:hypothetical protein
MKKSEVELNHRYTAKVSGGLTLVMLKEPLAFGGWTAINCATGRTIRIRSAARLRRLVTDEEYQRWLNRKEDPSGYSVPNSIAEPTDA